MDKDGEKRKPARKGHAVLLTVPDELMAALRVEARRRTVPPATAARQLMKERLDQVHEERRDER